MGEVHRFVGRFVFSAVLGTLAPTVANVAQAAAPSASTGIAWHTAASDADVDRAFALARQAGKPVFLYWGAVWCPPCNQVKATLFSRPDFVERSRAFVAVYVDGDRPGAQKVASRFRVSGYPTMILFRPDATEVIRLPGEVDPERYLLTLTAGLNAQTPVKELVRRGLAGQPLSAEQWRLLAFYSWDTDEQQVLSTSELPQRLRELAAAAPADLGPVRDRIAFKAIVAKAKTSSAASAGEVEADRRVIDRVLGDAGGSRQLVDLLIAYADLVVRFLAPEGDSRKLLASKWDSALAQLLEGGTLSRSDRIDALDGRVSLWKLIDGSVDLPAQRRDLVVREVARVVAATTDRYERQAVVPSAGHVLTQAGMLAESDALLKAELPKAVAPYYHMLILGGNAKKRGDAKTALHWYEQAWKKSEGPATRIQWGSNYVVQLLDLAPAENARIAAAAGAIISELEPRSETFYERNQRSLQRMAKRLKDWQGTDTARAQQLDRVKSELARICVKLPTKEPGRANCEQVFAPLSTSTAS